MTSAGPSSVLRPRRKTRQIHVGAVAIGGDAPVSVQSMLVNATRDVAESIAQIHRLADAGCEIIRIAAPDREAADALRPIVAASPIPVIADIHFDYRLALQAADNGVHGLRINPGNIGGPDFIRAVVVKARERELPIRIGVNSGSVEKPIKARYAGDRVTQLVESALYNVRLLEDEGFDAIKISVKSSDPMETVEAYRRLAYHTSYPLHLGVTEAGTPSRGLVKSALALGMLLADGIGDTLRISLTADSIEEVFAGHELLRSLGLRQEGSNLVSCPACGRCEIDLHGLTGHVEAMLARYDRQYGERPLTVAVMGCFVNGPGECGHADIGIAGGRGNYFVFKGEAKIARIETEDEALAVFERELLKAYRGDDSLDGALSAAEIAAIPDFEQADSSRQPAGVGA